jgi:O-antigen/teichoic acid export membrane protein
MVFGVLDLGLSTTINREIAIRAADGTPASDARDMLRTVEVIYWAIGVLIGVAIVSLAPVIATMWLHPVTLSTKTVERTICLMGLTAALQWPFTIYEGALHGLQRIVEFNAVTAGMQIVRAVGAVAVVSYARSLSAFFIWQVCVSAVTALLLARATWRCMPAGGPPRPRWVLLRQVWRFALGMSASAALGLLLSQSDRIVLSRLLPLDTFGYYGIAASVSAGLFYLMSPISLTFLPRFTELVTRRMTAEIIQTYHASAQLMASVLSPAAAVLSVFAFEVALTWTRSHSLASNITPLIRLLVPAVFLYAVLDIPFMLQLAQGRARLAVYTNLFSALFYLPLLIVMAKRFGAMGGAVPFLLLYVVKFLVWGQVIHQVLLPTETWRWYRDDVLAPALAAFGVAICARIFVPASAFSTPVVSLALLAGIAAVTSASTLAAAPLTRSQVFAMLASLSTRFRSAEEPRE